MTRGSTLLTLGVVFGLAYAFGQRKIESEKRPESQNALVDIDPDINEALDDEDSDGEKDQASPDERVSDPFWFRFRYGRKKRKCKFKYRYGRRCRPTTRPHTTRKPYTPECSSSRPTDIQWDNDWRGKLFFECPRGSSLVCVKSVFRDCQNDRIWKFGCGYNEASKEHCHWSHGYVNEAREGILFDCPNNGFVSGIDSIYNNGDRRFKFKCCNDERFDHADCHNSHLLNFPGQDFEYKVDRDKRFYITGIKSFFVPEKRDRRWKIDYCKSEEDRRKDYLRKKN